MKLGEQERKKGCEMMMPPPPTNHHAHVLLVHSTTKIAFREEEEEEEAKNIEIKEKPLAALKLVHIRLIQHKEECFKSMYSTVQYSTVWKGDIRGDGDGDGRG